MLIEISYALITEHMDLKAKTEFDAGLAKLSDKEGLKVRLVKNARGETVRVTQARIDEIRTRAGKFQKMIANR